MIKLFFIALVLLGVLPYFSKNRKLYALIWTCFLFVVLCFRNEVCFIDTPKYVNYYNSLSALSYTNVPSAFPKDSFFWLFSKVINDLSGGNYVVWFGVLALSFCLVLYYHIKEYSDDPFLSFLSFFVLGFFLFSTTGLRQTMSFAVVLFSFKFLVKNKPIFFIISVVLAALFHATALVFLLALPIKYLKFSTALIAVYVVLVVLCLAFGSRLMEYLSMFSIDERLDMYYEDPNTLNYSGLIIQLGIVLFALFVLGKDKGNGINSILLHMGFIGIVFQALSGAIAETFRLSMYFSMFDMVLLTKATSRLKHISNVGAFVDIGIKLVFIGYIIMSPNTGFNYPYLFYWE